MTRRIAGNVLATAAAVLVGVLTIYASLRYLKEPQYAWTWVALLDWSVLVFSGITTGVITFVTVWGHFQKEPAVGGTERS